MSKNLVIIGGSHGIGHEIVLQALAHNYTIYNFSRSELFIGNSNQVYHHTFDVLTDELSANQLPDIIDAFIYCPGSINLKSIQRLTKEDFRIDFEINVVAAFDAFQKCLVALKKANLPKALFFSSVAAQQGMTFHSSIAASKSAIEGFVKSSAAELAPKINVNCIALSLTDTPLAVKLLDTDAKKEAAAMRHPLKKYGQAKDIAALAMFLISDHASWISGQTIHADG